MVQIFTGQMTLLSPNEHSFKALNGSDCYSINNKYTNTYTHTRLTALCPGLPGWAGNRKEKPIWILLKQETVSGSGICWVICKSAPCSRQITMPAPHSSVFYRPDALPDAQTSVKALEGEQIYNYWIWKKKPSHYHNKREFIQRVAINKSRTR